MEEILLFILIAVLIFCLAYSIGTFIVWCINKYNDYAVIKELEFKPLEKRSKKFLIEELNKRAHEIVKLNNDLAGYRRQTTIYHYTEQHLKKELTRITGLYRMYKIQALSTYGLPGKDTCYGESCYPKSFWHPKDGLEVKFSYIDEFKPEDIRTEVVPGYGDKAITEDMYNGLKSENEKLKEENEHLNTKLGYLDRQERYFRQQYHKYERENKHIRHANTVLAGNLIELDELKNENIMLKKQNEEIRQYCENPCKNFAEAAKKLAEHLEAGKPTYDQLLKENEHLKAERESLDEECCYLNHQNSNLIAEIDILRAQLEGFEKKNGELVHDNIHLQNDIDTLSGMIDKLTYRLGQYKSQASRLEHQKIEAWKCASETLEARDKEVEKLKQQYNNLRAEYNKVQSAYEEYRLNNNDVSYYTLWKDLADKYAELEDKYNKVIKNNA